MVSNDILLADKVEHLMMEEIAELRRRNDYQLPQQQELAERYGVSLRSIRTVVDRLKARRVIRSVKGKGMFVVSKTQTSNQMLLVANDLDHFYTSMAISCASAVLLERGLVPVVVTPDKVRQNARNMCGALIIHADSELESYLEQSQLPYCAINDAFLGIAAHPLRGQTVRCNSYLWSYVTTEVLILSGKRQLFLFNGDSVHESWARDLVSGFSDAIHHYGLKLNPDFIIDTVEEPDERLKIFARAREIIKKTYQADGRTIGFVDGSGYSRPQSDFYHYVTENLCRPADVAVRMFEESHVTFVADTVVSISLSKIIERSVDLVLGQQQPFAICEQYDNFSVQRNEGGVWRKYAYPDFIKLMKSGNLILDMK